MDGVGRDEPADEGLDRAVWADPRDLAGVGPRDHQRAALEEAGPKDLSREACYFALGERRVDEQQAIAAAQREPAVAVEREVLAADVAALEERGRERPVGERVAAGGVRRRGRAAGDERERGGRGQAPQSAEIVNGTT